MKPFGVIGTLQKVRIVLICLNNSPFALYKHPKTETVEQAFRRQRLKRTCECLPVSISTDCIHGECNAWRYRVTGLLRSCYQCSFERSVSLYKTHAHCLLQIGCSVLLLSVGRSVVFCVVFSRSSEQINILVSLCVAHTTLLLTGQIICFSTRSVLILGSFIHGYRRMMSAILSFLPFESFKLILMRRNTSFDGHCLLTHCWFAILHQRHSESQLSFRFDGILYKHIRQTIPYNCEM